MLLHNPILPGFHPDPCICRKGKDYYIAVSSFEWMPGIPVYHSQDLKSWELKTHILTKESQVRLKGLPSAKGVWAPCLTYCEEDDLFYIVYGVMNNMNARYFDVNNYLMTAKDIEGPWSEPVYLHSSGFDASLLHDGGKKWLVSLEWETRADYEKPGFISLAEYDARTKSIVGYPRKIWTGGTDRGCIEAPHLYKKNGYYYIMCAEGGTGYYHSVTVGRSENVFGPYEPDPANPILTSSPGNFNERKDWDHLKPRYYNPQSYLQKSGHGSYIDTPEGETWLVHLTSRPFLPELRCSLGRETAIQRMTWTPDGWLRLADPQEGNLAKEWVEASTLPDHPLPQIPSHDDFDEPDLRNCYYAPRQMPQAFCDLTSRPGWLRMRGAEARTSLNEVSILARKLTSLQADITTRMDFHPQIHQHSAGLILYYDNMNYINLRKYYSEHLKSPAIMLTWLENGTRHQLSETRTAVTEAPLYLKMTIRDRNINFFWSYTPDDYRPIGPTFDLSLFSDEYSSYGEFTGTFVGLTCADHMFHRHTADFDFLDCSM